MSPPLAEDENPPAEAISILMASSGDSSKKRKSADVPLTPLQSPGTSMDLPRAVYCRKRLKRSAELHANEPASSPTGKKCLDGSSELPSVPGLKDMTTGQFACFIQNSMSYFNLQLQKDKEELEKVVETKEQNLKDREKENASLQGDKKELEKVMVALKHDVKGKDEEIASLKSMLKIVVDENDSKDREKKELQKVMAAMDKEMASLKTILKTVADDRGPMLKVYTRKLLKTIGFSRFCKDLTTLAQKLGRHVAARKIQGRYPNIPPKALAGLEDFLAESKLNNLFFSRVQEDAFKFPLLEHLLSLEEIPSSSKLKHFNVDEDENAMIPPPPVPATQS